MKTRLTMLKFLIVLCTVAKTTAFGQTIWWIGPGAALPGGANFGRSTNWSGDNGFGGTTPRDGTICTFDGTVPGNLVVYSHDGRDGNPAAPIGGAFGPLGFSIDMTPSQTGSVSLICYTGVTASAAMGFDAFRVQTNAGQLIFGDNSTCQLVTVLKPASSLHTFINNSANPVIINPNFQLKSSGGAAGQIINFLGTGDFSITNNLRWNNNAPGATLQWDSTGTTIWTAGGVNNEFNDAGLTNIIINAGKVVVEGSDLLPFSPNTTVVSNGTLIVNGSNSSSTTIVNGGTLGGTGIVGQVSIQSGGTLSPGTSIGTLTVSSNLTIAGNIVVEVNKSLAQSDFVIVSGTLSNSGTGTITVSKLGLLGTPLAPGDKFTLFNKPVQNGALLAITGARASWINSLEVDGSIIVSPPVLNFTNLDGTNLQFSWTGDYGLQWQTNSLNVGLSNNWENYPGAGTSPVTVPINVTRGAVFFRLIPVPVPFLRQENP